MPHATHHPPAWPRRSAAVLAALVAVLGSSAPAAGAQPAESAATQTSGWTTRIDASLSRHALGLPARASSGRLARAALARHADALRLRGSLAGLRLASRLRVPGGEGARAFQQLRFQQSAGGLRVVWSQIDVTIAAGRVRSVAATVVPVRGRLAGRVRIDRQRALAIARRAVVGPEHALRPLQAAYAGTPATARHASDRTARRVWVVEVDPGSAAGEDAAPAVCIVVDAESGRVVGRWPGMADRPDRGPDARGARATTRIADARERPGNALTVFDGTGKEDPEPSIDATPYAAFLTTGDARISASWPTYREAREERFPLITPTVAMEAVSANTANVARTICVVRGWCGRRGGFQPSARILEPWIVIGNTTGRSHAERVSLDVAIASGSVIEGDGDPNVPANDIVAHEFGHVMDWVYAGDRFVGGSSFMGKEVEEALADMFAYEYDRFDATLGEETPLGTRLDWADPAAVGDHPAHMSDYDTTPPPDPINGTPDEHFNGTILSHAYYHFVQFVGHARAGRVLHNVPSLLSPRPTFAEVAAAFRSRATTIYGPGVAGWAQAAFTRVGLPPS